MQPSLQFFRRSSNGSFCEFLTDSTVQSQLPAVNRFFYYVYAVAFLLLANWTLLFMIPAVLLRASGTFHSSGKASLPDSNDVPSGNMISDLVGAFTAFVNGSWPLRVELASTLTTVLEGKDDEDPRTTVSFKELRELLPGEAQKHRNLEALISCYDKKLGGNFWQPAGDEPAEAIEGGEEDVDSPFAVIPYLSDQANKLVRVRVKRAVMQCMTSADHTNVDWEAVATELSCSVLQEAYEVISGPGMKVKLASDVSAGSSISFADEHDQFDRKPILTYDPKNHFQERLKRKAEKKAAKEAAEKESVISDESI
jgi:hypothetical protein